MKKKTKYNDLWTEWMSLGIGGRLYVCFSKSFAGPIGFVWGIPIGKKPKVFIVFGSYVIPWARRKGVRTEMNRIIMSHVDQIHTGSRAMSKEGAAFMKKQGYVDFPNIGAQILKSKKWEQYEKTLRKKKKRR